MRKLDPLPGDLAANNPDFPSPRVQEESTLDVEPTSTMMEQCASTGTNSLGLTPLRTSVAIAVWRLGGIPSIPPSPLVSILQ